MAYFRAAGCDIFVPRIWALHVCERARAGHVFIAEKREDVRKRKYGGRGRSLAGSIVALSSSSSSPFFRSPCCASLRGDVIYSADFTRVCKQAERKRCAMQEEKERRGERERETIG